MIRLAIEMIASIAGALHPSYRRCVMISVMQEVSRPLALRIILPLGRMLIRRTFRFLARYTYHLSIGLTIINGLVWVVQWTREPDRS